MAKPQQLPSGKWRIRIYDNELKKQVSYVSSQVGRAGKAEAELFASEYILGKRRKEREGKTVGECIDEYINSKEHILSPRTVSEYRKCKKNDLAEICDIPLCKLTASDIQKQVNMLSMKKSAKTVRNAHGLLRAVLHVFVPEMYINTTLPKVQKKIKHLPKAEDVLKAVSGTEIELPCLLAMWLGMKMSEIRGAKRSNIKDGVLTISEVIVKVDGADVVKKQTKTTESTRQLRVPPFIQQLIDNLPPEQDYLTTLNGAGIYKRFQRLLNKNGVEHMTFHDLRHMNASIMLALGIPDKYAMERGGWSSPSVMKSVYQHTFSAERQQVDDKVDRYFEKMIGDVLDTKLDTTSK